MVLRVKVLFFAKSRELTETGETFFEFNEEADCAAGIDTPSIAHLPPTTETLLDVILKKYTKLATSGLMRSCVFALNQEYVQLVSKARCSALYLGPSLPDFAPLAAEPSLPQMSAMFRLASLPIPRK